MFSRLMKAAQVGNLEEVMGPNHAEADMQERKSEQAAGPSAVRDPTNFDEFVKWNSSQVAGYVEQQGVKAGDAFIDHRIDGSILHLLNEHHFENMGIKAVGDVVRLMLIFEKLKNMQKMNHREKAIWEAEEYIMSDMCQLMCCKFASCCFMCLEKGDNYKMTAINLRIKQKKPVTCCFTNVRGSCAAIVRSCTGTEYSKLPFAAIVIVNITPCFTDSAKIYCLFCSEQQRGFATNQRCRYPSDVIELLHALLWNFRN
jgi:hypothetical protein